MDRLLARLERRFGKYAIEHLTWLLVGGAAIVLVIAYTRPALLEMLMLDTRLVAHGQVWRLVTYIFMPRSMQLIDALFGLYWLWLMGTNLEQEWGPFKFNAYWFIGMVATTAGAFITGAAVGGFYLTVSLTLAFATVFPDYQMLMMLIIPMKMKWMGWIAAAFLAYEAATKPWEYKVAIIAAVANYLVFFSGHLLGLARGKSIQMKQAARRESFRPPAETSTGDAMGQRACAICGAREDAGTDIRVCSCEKCGGKPRALCLEHARNH
jgi:membrane associated rhomboid family serine protease